MRRVNWSFRIIASFLAIVILLSACKREEFDFDENGNETKTDFKKMFQLIQKHSYNGWLGVEFEGEVIATLGFVDAVTLKVPNLTSASIAAQDVIELLSK